MQKQVHPIHFEDYSGQQFERLCFAYLLRRPDFLNVDWFGQLGQDGGRDIICSDLNGRNYIFQCANYRRLTTRKIEEDLGKLSKAPLANNSTFYLVTGGSVSGLMKQRVSDTAIKVGFSTGAVWSGSEFEERLRIHAPDLLLRFTEGVEFPENHVELKSFAANSQQLTDELIISALTIAFDRPAFKTPFYCESSLPRFKAAIQETINTLNTGTTATGKVLPSKNDVKNISKRRQIDDIVQSLVSLRAAFERLIHQNEIKRCSCANADCSIYMMTDNAINEMDDRRQRILNDVSRLNPNFSNSFYRMR